MITPLPGDFQVVPSGPPVGTLIKVGQWLNGDGWCPVQHARIYIGNRLFVEAEPGGARIAEHWLNEGFWSTGHITPTDAQRAEIVRIARLYVGTPYSAADYLALVAHRFNVPLPGLRDYIANSRQMICSQLVDYCYMKAGVQLFDDGRWPGYVTPADLYNLLR